MNHLKWGLLAAGSIAKAFAKGLSQTDSGEVLAVGSRSPEKGKSFADELGIPKHYSYDDLLADPEIDAVYISTPHPMHAEWAIKAADAGKHILCEKPLTVNYPDAQTVVEAARHNDVFLMEAFMYRCNPQTQKLVNLICEGAIGDVRVIDAVFSFHGAYDLQSRLLNPELGGGGILDVGCYTVSMVRLVAGAALGRDVAEPLDVKGHAHLGQESGVDEWATALLKFDNDILARLATGVQLNQDNRVIIYGSEGRIVVPSPWFCNGREAGTTTINLTRQDGKSEDIIIDVSKSIYALEADTVADNIGNRQAPSPAMSWDDSLGNAKTLDRWRAAIGLEYPCESAAAYAMPLDRRPLRVCEPNRMSYGEIPGVNKSVSRLVMGAMAANTISETAALYDDFFQRGGNCFDTAYVYGGGLCERLLGQWAENRDREQLVIIGKGAHTPNCHPEGLLREFDESLERLRTDYVDLYFMHRDNPEIPVGEFVDVLNDLKSKGRIRAFGGSNWTMVRFDEATAWANEHGKTGFAALSNNFSLAQMIDPPWAGCLASSTPEFSAWHEKTQTPLFAWSSQAQGFFVPGRADRGKSEGDLARCWYSDDNFERLARCCELADRKGVHPMALALAYVLHQPFPTFALIGPAKLSETCSSLAALEVELTPEELKWLKSGK